MCFNGEHDGGVGLTVDLDGVGGYFQPWKFYDSMEAEISLVFLSQWKPERWRSTHISSPKQRN